MKLKALFDTDLHALLFRFPSLPIQIPDEGQVYDQGRTIKSLPLGS